MTKETAIEILEGQKNEHYKEELNEALDMAISALSADVRPNIHGHWEDRDGISDFMYCSNCGGKKHYSEKWIGCPYCMADMRELKDIIHEAIDNTPFAEEAYPNIKEKLHKAVDMAEPKGEKGGE